jgi:hypothetical protein
MAALDDLLLHLFSVTFLFLMNTGSLSPRKCNSLLAQQELSESLFFSLQFLLERGVPY